MAKYKTISVHPKTLEMINELVEFTKENDADEVQFISKAYVIHKLVEKAHTQRGLKK